MLAPRDAHPLNAVPASREGWLKDLCQDELLAQRRGREPLCDGAGVDPRSRSPRRFVGVSDVRHDRGGHFVNAWVHDGLRGNHGRKLLRDATPRGLCLR